MLLRLAATTEEPRYAAEAERTLVAFAGGAPDAGLFVAAYLQAVDFLLNRACHIVVANTTTIDDELRRVALAAYRPRKVVVPAEASPVPGIAGPMALACIGTACAAPVTDAAALSRTLETFGREG